MSKDSTRNRKVKLVQTNSVKLPEFIDNNDLDESSIDGTNIIRVPFGKRLSKKKRPQKNQNIATLILPITSFSSPTPPNVA